MSCGTVALLNSVKNGTIQCRIGLGFVLMACRWLAYGRSAQAGHWVAGGQSQRFGHAWMAHRALHGVQA